jgi:prepilin-type processing-associated H-X9-DG protein
MAKGWPGRLRSLSMNAFFGRFSPNDDPTAQGKNYHAPTYRQFLKTSDVPIPVNTWVTLEEHPDSINDGYFLNTPGATGWQDIPASYHNGAAGFSFADGHSETHKWLSKKSSVIPVRFALTTTPFDALGYQDFEWWRLRVPFILR